jgi:hypothetical protein
MEGDVGDRAGVAEERQVLRARFALHGRGIPDSDSLVQGRRGELVAVGAESHTERVVNVTTQREYFLPSLCVPQLNGVIQAR